MNNSSLWLIWAVPANHVLGRNNSIFEFLLPLSTVVDHIRSDTVQCTKIFIYSGRERALIKFYKSVHRVRAGASTFKSRPSISGDDQSAVKTRRRIRNGRGRQTRRVSFNRDKKTWKKKSAIKFWKKYSVFVYDKHLVIGKLNDEWNNFTSFELPTLRSSQEGSIW